MRALSRYSRTAESLLFGLLFLFFFQLLTDFIAAVYAFGLMGLNIPPEIASVLLLFSPLLLVFARRPPGRGARALLGGGVIACRMVEALLPTRERMLVSGLGTALFLLLFAALLAGREEDGAPGETSLGLGLALGVGLAALLRAAGSGIDLASLGMFKAISWLLGALAVALYLLVRRAGPAAGGAAGAPALPARERPGSFGKLAGLSIGLGAAFTLLYFGFIAPDVIARWTGAGRLPVYAGVGLALAAFAGLTASARLRQALLRPGVIAVWNALFVLALALTLRAQTEHFPAGPQAYPLAVPAAPAWMGIALAAALLLFPVILVDGLLYIREIRCLRPSARQAGAGFSLAGLVMLLLVFGQVFTTVYDYIPVVGPLFRDRFWLVYLAGGLALALPLALVDWKRQDLSARLGRWPQIGLPAAGIAAAALAALLVAAFVPGAPQPSPDARPELRVITYNIQQGYSAGGQENAAGQLRVLRSANADIIGLEESDTSRVSGGNDDLVGFFAGQLGMYAYYGPDVVKGTFGIALLSRYPIQNASTYYMYSSGEQTAAIHAQVVKAGRTFNIFVTHLGNGGPLVQQQQFLQGAAGLENVVAMGDFNFYPREDPYRLTVKSLPDAWTLRWPSGADDAGQGIADEIDHIFVSPGTRVGEARYLTGPDSDHPALMVQVEW